MSLLAFALAFTVALALGLDKFAGFVRVLGTCSACMPRVTADIACVDARVRLCAGVRASRSIGIGGCTFPTPEVEAYAMSIWVFVRGLVSPLVGDRCDLLLHSPTFRLLVLRWLIGLGHRLSQLGSPKGLVKGRDGVVLPVLGDRSIAFNVIVQGFEADSDLVCRPLEMIVPPTVCLFRVD